jgi:hypothetical protein
MPTTERVVTATRIGPVVAGHAPPMPDPSTKANLEAAEAFRSLRLVGPTRLPKQFLQDLTVFWSKWVSTNIRPSVVTPDFDGWLESRKYPTIRKEELRRAHTHLEDASLGKTIRAFQDVVGHIKAETYPALKAPRFIHSRTDLFKVYWGPWVHMMEEYVFSLPWFVKHIPVRERPAAVEAMIAHYPYKFVSDYSKFESSLRVELREAIEYQVYRAFGVPEWFLKVLSSPARIRMRNSRRGFRAMVTGSRMSGEMDTSLGNSLLNLGMFLFWAHDTGNQIEGMVEGDDGAFGATAIPDPQWFAERGFEVDIRTYGRVGEMGFLSTYWTEDGVIVAEPTRLVKLGWSHHLPENARPARKRELFAATCMSLGYELGSSPYYWAVARKYARPGRLRNEYWTRAELESFGAKYEIREQWIYLSGRVRVRPPTMKVRMDYFLMFGIPPEAQVEAERQILAGELQIDEPHTNVWLDSRFPDLATYAMHYMA